MFKTNNKNTIATSMTLNIFQLIAPFSSVSIANFEQVNISWDISSDQKIKISNCNQEKLMKKISI